MEDILEINKKGTSITIVGLPYAGKTTLVNWMVEKRFTRPKPTVGLKFYQITIGDVNFNIFDLSGQAQYRETLWESYVMTSAGIIFVLDSTDNQNIEEAKKWFWIIVNEWLKGIFADKVVLFIANKSDLKKSMKLDKIIQKLDLMQMSRIQNVSFQFFKTSIRMGENVDLALKWFFSRVNQAIEKHEHKPNAIILTTSDGTPIYVHDPQSIVDDTGMFIGYLLALSGFTDELLGQEKFKVIKIDDYFFFISEESKYVVSIAVSNEAGLPEARRLAFLIHEQIKKDKNKADETQIKNYLDNYLS